MKTWTKQKLGDVADVYDCPHSTPKWVKEGYFVIRNFNLSNGRIIKEKASYTDKESYLTRIKRAAPEVGDSILSREAPIGTVGYVKTDEKICLGQRVVLIKPKAIDSKFLLYKLISSEVQKQFNMSNSSGSTVSNLRIPLIKNTEINVPDLDTQKLVATVIYSYDSLIENNEKRIKILEEMAQRLYTEWFVKFKFPGHEKVKMVESGTEFGMIPEGWKVKRLGDLADLVMGQSPTSNYYNLDKEGLPFHQGVADFGDKYPVDRVYSRAGNKYAEDHDLLFSVRAPVGRMNIANNKIILGRGLCAIRRKDKLQALLYLMFTQKFTKKDMIGNGAIYMSVNKIEIENIKFLTATDSLEKEINDIAAIYLDEIKKISLLNLNLSKTRDLLIPQLVTGRREIYS